MLRIKLSYDVIYQSIQTDRSILDDLSDHIKCRNKHRKRLAGGRERSGLTFVACLIHSEQFISKADQDRVTGGVDTLLIKVLKQEIVSLVGHIFGYEVLRKVSLRPRIILVQQSSTIYYQSRKES